MNVADERVVAGSARDAILIRLGVEADVGLLGYWRSHELYAALVRAREQLSDWAEHDIDQWWESATRVQREALLQDVGVPWLAPVRRPWTTLDVRWATRIPYVPLGAFLHAMATGGHRTVGSTADVLGISEDTTPWDLLEQIDDRIADTPEPPDLVPIAGGLRLAFNGQPDDEAKVHSPVRWLLQQHRSARWSTLAAVAEDATAKEKLRQEQLAARRKDARSAREEAT